MPQKEQGDIHSPQDPSAQSDNAPIAVTPGETAATASRLMNRLARLPQRARQDGRVVALLSNWPEVLAARARRRPLPPLEMRRGGRLFAPPEVSFEFVFVETWIDRIYNPPGFEVRANETVVDIGANVGLFTTYAACAAPGVRVVACEPFPPGLRWIERNVRSLGLDNVSICPLAVSDHEGTQTLHVTDAWICNSLFPLESTSASPGAPAAQDAQGSMAGSTAVEVRTVSLEQLLDEQGVDRCGLLKIDCEGSEYDILQSASPQTLARIERISGEYHHGPQIEGTGTGLAAFLESSGFHVQPLQPFDSHCGLFLAHR
jgi:FkbM family methyltransferase